MARLPWPLPALLAWAAAWLLFSGVQRVAPVGWALLLACVLGVAASVLGSTWWRRVLIAAGFPLALWLAGAVALSAAWWLAPLALLLCVYPLNAWRDAPLFPTPHQALQDLATLAPLAAGARVLDAGCGLGDGLIALRRAYPQVRIEGVERSWLLCLACRLRCPWARVHRGDMWGIGWEGCALVYLFQRPESMERALAKARADMPSGAWLASLEFPVPGVPPDGAIKLGPERSVWLYRVAARDKAHAGAAELPGAGAGRARGRRYFGR